MARRGRPPAGGPDLREAILAAARDLFAARGFEATTMRAVAARAGVDPALIHHYFGSKDGLLAEALALPVDPAELLRGVGDHPERIGEQVARRVLTTWDRPDVQQRLVALLRIGLSHEQAGVLLRELLARTVLQVLRGYAVADEPTLRASLVASQLGGLALARYVLRVPPLADAPVEQLVAAVGPSVQRYLTEPLVAPVAPPP